MEYKEFISKLYIRGAGSKKVELSKNLFLSAVNDPSTITYNRNSDESYKGYNRGNSIKCISYDVINDLNQLGIESCIEEYLNKMHDKRAENVQKICGNFKEAIPDLTPENISKRISSFFVDEVLKTAAKEYEKTIAKNVSSEIELPTIPNETSGNIKTDVTFKEETTSKESLMEEWYSQLQPPSPPFSELELGNIEEIVRKMHKTLVKIANLDLYQYIENNNPSHSFCLSKDEIIRQNKNCIPKEIYKKFIEYYDVLHELSIDLQYYSEMHMYCPLNDTVNSYAAITLDNYLLGNPIVYQTPLKINVSLLSFAIQKLRN